MAKNELLEKLKKNTTIENTAQLDQSIFFGLPDMIQTQIPAINVALSGKIDGGLVSGLTMFAGPSKHFKTLFSLVLAKAYMDKYPDSVMLFYDSEFGSPISYFTNLGIDPERVLHSPLTDIEVLKFDIMAQLAEIKRGDRIIIVIDSIGNLASKKEVEDALAEKSVADMTRAKQTKSLFRMVTPHLTIKDIPMIVVNHTYKEISLFPKDIVGGGCLVENTKLIMSDGTIKNIQDILNGDRVYTKDGPKDVTAIWNPETLEDGNPECLEIEFEDGFKVVCSTEHKFWINEQWIQAKDLKEGVEVSVV